MKTEKTEMIMKYFDVTYKVAKQYEVILKEKQGKSKLGMKSRRGMEPSVLRKAPIPSISVILPNHMKLLFPVAKHFHII